MLEVILFALAASGMAGALVFAGYRGRLDGPGVWEVWSAPVSETERVYSTRWFPQATIVDPSRQAVMTALDVQIHRG